MNERDRLTRTWNIKMNGDFTWTRKAGVNPQAAIDRLAAYEDTALSPEEVKVLKRECDELRARLERTVELEFQKGDHVFFISWLSGNVCEGEVIGWQEEGGYVILCDDAMISSYRCFDTREKAEARIKELEERKK